MKGYRYVITNPEGLHARIAVNLAKICRDAEGRIVVSAGDRKADGKEVFAVMNLYAVKGDELVFLVEGGDEEDSGVLRFTALAVNHNRKIFGERHSGYLPVFCLLRLF